MHPGGNAPPPQPCKGRILPFILRVQTGAGGFEPLLSGLKVPSAAGLHYAPKSVGQELNLQKPDLQSGALAALPPTEISCRLWSKIL